MRKASETLRDAAVALVLARSDITNACQNMHSVHSVSRHTSVEKEYCKIQSFFAQLAELFVQAGQMLSVCVLTRPGDTNLNRCTQRLVILYVQRH